jgi:hypothetical protein
VPWIEFAAPGVGRTRAHSWIEYEVTRLLIYLEAVLSLSVTEVHTVLGGRRID